MAYTKYSLTPANNTATPPDGAPEGMLPSAVNDTMRDMMAQIRDVGDGIRDGTYTMTAAKITGGTITGVAFTGNTFTSPVISGGSINNTPIGATTANTGAFTTLSATGVTTVQAGTVSAPAITTSGDTNTGIFFPAADTIAFTEGGVESMRIDSSGNVGIGTSTITSNVGWTPKLVLSAAAPAAIIKGQNSQEVSVGSFDGMYIDCVGNTTGTSNNIVFRNNSSNSSFTATERMRIDSGGNVLVNTTTVRNSGKVSIDFAGNSAGGLGINDTDSVNGGVYASFLSGGTFRGSITNNNNTAVAYNTTSDYRLKENISPMTGALTKVAQLKPVTYVWKSNGFAGQGFIAHELQEVIPDAVTGEKDAVDADGNPKYQGVDTSFLVATLTAALQEAHGLIKNLQSRVDALESK